jgi:glucose dehydrogenase
MARQIVLLSLIVVTILLMSSLAVLITTALPPANAQQQAGAIPSGDRAARNWEYANHDSWSTNYSPQTEINKDNVQYLELKWIFPNPLGATVSRIGSVAEGSTIPALIVDGTFYHSTNVKGLYAFDGVTGQTKWTNFYEFDPVKNTAEQAARGLAGVCTGGGGTITPCST